MGPYTLPARDPYHVWALLSSVHRSQNDWDNPPPSRGGGFRKPVWEGDML